MTTQGESGPVVVVREGRPEDAAGIARVHVDSWRTTYAGILPAAFLANLSYEQRERQWDAWIASAASGEGVVCVAEETLPMATGPEARQIVGFASGGPPAQQTRRLAPTYDGELQTIYLLRSHQRRGLGRRLFRFVAERVASGGARSLFLWVARENSSRAFYEALGGRPIAETSAEIFGQAVDEVGYGWDDIRRLVSRLGTPGEASPTPE
jgi:ribosomal protein S18 acetylase RimI-like enzyme